jgi:hypothetical protein
MKNKAPGIRELLKDYPEIRDSTVSQEDIISLLTDIYEKYLPKAPSWKHYTWEENGQSFSMWCFDNICTGDGGFALFQEKLKEYAARTN